MKAEKTTPKLIYDLGMHNGNDTAYYLQKGYCVLAIEANPLLVKKNQQRFATFIAEKKLTILNIGLSNKTGTFDFWVNEKHDEWSSFIKRVGCRDGSCHKISVRCTTLKKIIAKYGVPYYLKCDIEENDIYCLQDLTPETAPEYISVEAQSTEYIFILYSLGYRKFKCIDQLNHNNQLQINNENIFDMNRLKREAYWFVRSVANKSKKLRRMYKTRNDKNALVYDKFLSDKKNKSSTFFYRVLNSRKTWHFFPGSSGPFAEDTNGKWQSVEEITYAWLHYKLKYKMRGNLDRHSWFDFHAKKSV